LAEKNSSKRWTGEDNFLLVEALPGIVGHEEWPRAPLGHSAEEEEDDLPTETPC
jgi:hypothetical protein